MTDDPKPGGDDLVRLAKLVKVMREAQKRFFAGDRSAAVIGQAKDLERRVDKAVAWVLANRGESEGRRQAELFADDPQPSASVGPYRKGGGL